MSKYGKYLSEGGERVELSPPKKRNTSVLSLRVPCELMDRLGETADELGMSTGGLARQLIQEGLDHRAGRVGLFTLTETSPHNIAKVFAILKTETSTTRVVKRDEPAKFLRHDDRMIADA